MSPSDFKHLDDLEKFPFTTKQDLRENYPFGMFAVPQGSVSYGCTLRPAQQVSPQSSATHETTSTRGPISSLARFEQAAPAPACLFISQSAMVCSPGALGTHYGAERLGCTVVPVAGGMTARQVQLILDFRPDVIVPTPSYLLVILDEFLGAQGLDPSRTSLTLDRVLRGGALD